MTITAVWNNFPEITIVTDRELKTFTVNNSASLAVLCIWARRMKIDTDDDFDDPQNLIEKMIAACPMEI